MSRRLCAAVLAIAALTTTAEASRLRAADAAPPLAAWVELCERKPAECAVDKAEPEVITLTAETFELIDAVNRYVNRSIKPMRDQDHWAKIDQWDLPIDGYGDCEDYQLLKRKLLVEAGLPRRALRMTVVLDNNGEGHAVLTVRTSGDDLILDNQADAVLSWEITRYRFIKRESAHAVGWHFLEREPAPLVVAKAE